LNPDVDRWYRAINPNFGMRIVPTPNIGIKTHAARVRTMRSLAKKNGVLKCRVDFHVAGATAYSTKDEGNKKREFHSETPF
jgi:hypothetical protein